MMYWAKMIRDNTPDLTWKEIGGSMICSRDGVQVGGYSLRDLRCAVDAGSQPAWAFYLFVIRTVDP
jgi:hypothetical protein